jgi:hypothetical protein
MSLRLEQYNALKKTRAFLRSLYEVKMKSLTKRWLMKEASSCLHHFPPLWNNGQPIWSRDEFTEDVVETCKWSTANNYNGFNLSCGPVLLDRGYVRNLHMKYCPYCGRKIEVE